MAAYKQFDSKKLLLRYFPDDKVIFLLPKKGMDKHHFNLIKNKLETFLQIDSVKDENGGVSLKLSQNTSFSPEDLFRSFGFQGGTDVEDASSVASQASKTETEKEQAAAPQPNQNSPMAPPGAPDEQPLQDPLQQESVKLLFPFLFEDFWKPLKKKKKTGMVAPARRTGKYWKILERSLGKKRAKIKAEDVLRLRRKFGNQPYSVVRNNSLLAIDKAYRYFLIRIGREQGDGQKQKFKQDYISQAAIEASDYKPGVHKDLDNDTFGDTENQQQGLSIEDAFNIPEDAESQEFEDEADFDDEDIEDDDDEAGISYDDIDIEDEDTVPSL